MKNRILLTAALLAIGITSFAQTTPAPPTGSVPYSNQILITPSGTMSTGSVAKMYRVIASAKRVDSLRKVDSTKNSLNYIQNQNTVAQNASSNISGSATSGSVTTLNVVGFGGIQNNGTILPGNVSTATIVRRNLSDAVGTFIVNSANSGSTGNIFDVQFNSISKFNIGYNGLWKINNITGTAGQAIRINPTVSGMEYFTPANSADTALFQRKIYFQNSLTADASNLKYPSVSAVNTGLALKANDALVVHLAGTETITGSKSFTLSPTLTAGFLSQGTGTFTNGAQVNLSGATNVYAALFGAVNTGGGSVGRLNLIYNPNNDGTAGGTNYTQAIQANPQALTSVNLLPVANGTLLNTNDALNYAKLNVANNYTATNTYTQQSTFGAGWKTTDANNVASLQATTLNYATAPNRYLGGLNFYNSLQASPFTSYIQSLNASPVQSAMTYYLPSNSGTIQTDVSQAAAIAANNTTYPVNSGGENLNSVLTRGNTSASLPILLGAAAFSSKLNVQESATYAYGLSIVNRNATKRYSIGVDVAAIDDGFFAIADNTAGIYRFTMNSAGKVGIGTGTAAPASQLTVTGGDVEVTTIGSGEILAAPNGSRWRVTVSNTGVLTTTAL